MTNITPIINAVIALLAAVVTAFVVPWLKKQTTAKDRESFCAWVKILVAAAEQVYSAAQGEEKKQYVVSRLQELGLAINAAEVDDAIEAAVLALHHELYGGAAYE